MCGPYCAAPQDTAMTCDDCQDGIKASADQLVLPKILESIIITLLDSDFCASSEHEGCESDVTYVIMQGLPMLVLGFNPTDGPAICNTAVEGTCPARRARLFKTTNTIVQPIYQYKD